MLACFSPFNNDAVSRVRGGGIEEKREREREKESHRKISLVRFCTFSDSSKWCPFLRIESNLLKSHIMSISTGRNNDTSL